MIKESDVSYTIGLDISTSIIGICIFKNKAFVKLIHIDLTKEKCMFQKAKIVKTNLTFNGADNTGN